MGEKAHQLQRKDWLVSLSSVAKFSSGCHLDLILSHVYSFWGAGWSGGGTQPRDSFREPTSMLKVYFKNLYLCLFTLCWSQNTNVPWTEQIPSQIISNMTYCRGHIWTSNSDWDTQFAGKNVVRTEMMMIMMVRAEVIMMIIILIIQNRGCFPACWRKYFLITPNGEKEVDCFSCTPGGNGCR